MRAALAIVLVGCYAPSPQPGAPCANSRCPQGLVCSPATNTCEREAIDAAVIDAPIDAPVIDVMPSAFAYRRRISIQNTSATALPVGFTIRIPLGATLQALIDEGKLRSDLADLRVIGDTLGERDRIVDPPDGPAAAAVWFSLAEPLAAGATTTDYALYYGAPTAAGPPSSGPAVFPVYDDFTNGIAPLWSKNAAPMTSAGQLVLRANQTDAIVTDAATDNVPVVSAVDLVATVMNPASDPTPQPEGTFYYWFGYQRTGDFTASDPWIVWIARAKNEVRGEQKSPVGCEMECAGGATGQNTATHHYAIERDPAATRFYRDGALAFTTAVTNSADYAVIVRNYMATSDLRVDWIRARARVSPDPTVSLGAEQPN